MTKVPAIRQNGDQEYVFSQKNWKIILHTCISTSEICSERCTCKRWWAEVCRLLWDTEPTKEHRIHFRSWVCLQRVLTGRPLAGLRPPLRHIRQTSKHRSQVDHMFLFFFQVLCGCGPPSLLTFHLGPSEWGSGLAEVSSLLHQPSDGLENYD